MQTENEPLLQTLSPAGAGASSARTRAWLALWPPAAAAALLLLIVGGLEYWEKVFNGGVLTYALDDVYLHMALAKNLALHGVWGFSALNGFSSCASSLIYPLLLAACDIVFGDRQLTPLVINLVASMAALFYAASILRRFSIVGWRNFLVLAAMVVFVPLPAVISTGMEHSLQVLITLAFVDVAATLLANDLPAGTGTTGRQLALLVLGCLLTGIRYEGLFLIGITGLLLLCRRRWLLAVLLGIVAAAPLVIFGWYSVRQGWYPLPNSILIKGNAPPGRSGLGFFLYLITGAGRIADRPHLVILSCWLALALAMEWRRRRTLWTYEILLLVMTLGAMALQAQFAKVGWFYRYEAYLMVLGLLALGIWAFGRSSVEESAVHGWHLPERRVALVFSGVLAFAWLLALSVRTERTIEEVPLACHNIYEQQYQMGRFVRQFYNGKGVAANDVGAIDYLADIRLFDIFGLANLDVLRARRADHYDGTVVKRLLDQYQVRVIMVYDDWANLYGGIPPAWRKVGEWTLQDNVICAAPTVSFYAPDSALVPELTHAMQQFAPLLPKSVRQSGLYCDAANGNPPTIAARP